MKFDSKVFGLVVLVAVGSLLFAVANQRPAYITNVTILGALLLLEVVAVAVWHYERWFFLIMMLSFLWAGSALPLSSAGGVARWIFLGVGALVGFVRWGHSAHRQPFTVIHLVALLCIMAAVVSAFVSHRSEMSLLKTASLFSLFLYEACGARLAVAGRERYFFSGMITACEAIAYISAVSYGIAHFELFGNPNSLGAVMGVVVVPVLLWAVVTTEDRHVRQRQSVALCIAVYLLYSSVSRAAILGCVLAAIVMCIALRRQHLLVKGAFILIFMGALVAVVQPTRFDALVTAFTEDVIYKGKPQQGLLGSRQSPWQDTVAVIKESPWFGSGFGTDLSAKSIPGVAGGLEVATAEGLVREHGNSYLALLQYVGLLGILPFLILFIFIVRQIGRGCSQMWRTQDARAYAVPLVLICVSGLIHAFFEDWLFAVGSYLNIFFWTSAFLLAQLQSERAQESTLVGRRLRRMPRSGIPMPAPTVPVSSDL
jgi:O-antigen ligase